MRIVERDWNWWAYFWRVIHRQTIPNIEKWDKDVVRFNVKILGCKKGEKLLDLGCGSGEHTRLLAKKGLKCVGIEIASSLVKFAKGKAKEEGVEVKYLNRDMRKIDYKEEFEYCIMISGTFGYFSDYGNFNLLQKIRKALSPKGKVLLDIKNAQYPRKGGRSWMYINNGYLLSGNGEIIFIDQSGNVNILAKHVKRESIRLYTIPAMKKILHKAGLKFLNAYCGYKIPPKKYTPSYKHNIIITAQKMP